jgi:hypothetical protein
MTVALATEHIPSRLRYSTPFYELVVCTSPARIERLGVDAAGRGRYLGVINNFGPKGSAPFASYGSRLKWHEDRTFEAGTPTRVSEEQGRLTLEHIPVGPHGLLVSWSFEFVEREFTMQFDWHAETSQQALWEVGWKLDGIARHLADEHNGDLRAGYRGAYRGRKTFAAWWEDDPRYEHTLVSALIPGTADRGEDLYVEPLGDRPAAWAAWLAVSAPGGTTLSEGERFSGGRWRIAASNRAADLAFASALAEGADVPAASPTPRSELSDRDAAIAWIARHASDLRDKPTGASRLNDGTLVLVSQRILVALVPDPNGWFRASIYAWCSGCWALAACGGPSIRYVAARPDEAGMALLVESETRDDDNAVQGRTFERWVLDSHPERLHVDSKDTLLGSDGAHTTHTWLAYPDGRTKHELQDGYDAIVAPHLRPRADLVIGQHTMRSPAVGVQHGSAWVALVPDLLVHRQHGHYGIEDSPRQFGLCLDLDVANRLVDGTLMSFGWRMTDWQYSVWHVEEGYFCQALAEPAPARTVPVCYDMIVAVDAPPQDVVSATQAYLWERVGHRYFELSPLPQTQPADGAFDEAWSWGSGLYEQRTVNGRSVGAVRVDREFPPDAMFMTWFNALRTAYGIFSQGRSREDDGLRGIGRSTLDLLLSAPTNRGAFPTIASFRSADIVWYGSHKNFANQMPWGPRSFNTFDMGWTAYWVLRWYQDLEPDPTALAFARNYGGFVLNVQLPSGAVPSWLAMDDLRVDAHLRQSAQTASSLLFLAELAAVTGEEEFLRGAEAAGEYVVREHVREQRWDDYEVYYSNAPKSEGAADPISGMSAQDTLSMHLAAAGLLALWRVTREDRWISEGQRALSQLIQYQAVWPASFLSLYSFGGFSVQNTDQEWNDARQAQFAPTLLAYARATGRREYAERGIAALRSAYATMCSRSAEIINPRYFDYQSTGWGNENYAHNPYDAPTTPVPAPHFDWGVGSANAAFAEVREHFGDVWVDLADSTAYGIDNAQVTSVQITPETISFDLRSTTPGQTVLMKAHGDDDAARELRVNGQSLGSFSAGQLHDGVKLHTRHRPRIVHNPARAAVPVAGGDFAVSLRANEGTHVTSATVRYRVAGESWQVVRMSPSPGGFTGMVPGVALRVGQLLEYAIAAETASGGASAPEVDPMKVPFRQVIS